MVKQTFEGSAPRRLSLIPSRYDDPDYKGPQRHSRRAPAVAASSVREGSPAAELAPIPTGSQDKRETVGRLRALVAVLDEQNAPDDAVALWGGLDDGLSLILPADDDPDDEPDEPEAAPTGERVDAHNIVIHNDPPAPGLSRAEVARIRRSRGRRGRPVR